MQKYLDLVKLVLDEGTRKENRTGIDTLSYFAAMFRHDMQTGFPLLTTKSVHWPSVIHELLFFLAGDTNRKLLSDKGIKIWNDWGDANGNLGPVYSHQWRNFGGKHANRPQPKPQIPTGHSPTVYGVASAAGYSLGTNHTDSKYGEELDKLFITWKGLLARCYDPQKDTYAYYGGRGVYVCNEWLVFTRFAADVRQLESWTAKAAAWDDYQLDKDVAGDGFCYSPRTCVWLHRDDNAAAKYRKMHTLQHDDGREVVITNPVDFYTANGIAQGNFCSMLRGERERAGGWRLVKTVDRDKGFDQVSWVIAELKKNPMSRRCIVSAWNPFDVPHMALPPCHYTFCFNVQNVKRLVCDKCGHASTHPAYEHYSPCPSTGCAPGGRLQETFRRELCLHWTQRSCDIALGIPFNIASYAALQEIIARELKMPAGILAGTFVDLHAYTSKPDGSMVEYDHVPGLREQLKRQPGVLPRLEITGDAPWDKLSFNNFRLIGYNPQPKIQFKVAV
jgi:thymidylate synthase